MLCTESVVADPPRFEHGLQLRKLM